MIHVWIPGQPKTKGSLDPKNMQDTPASHRWRTMMAFKLAQEHTLWPKGTPVAVRAVFWLPVDDVTMSGCGDLDKLARNLLDAGTDSLAYADDVQVVRLFVDKVSCGPGVAPGVVVTIWAPDPWEINDWIASASAARTRAERAQG